MVKRRGWHDIVAEMLKTARDGKLKTHIMLKARLSQNQMNKYLPFLIDKGLIENLMVKKKKFRIRLYRTTLKGLKLMEILVRERTRRFTFQEYESWESNML